MTLPYHSIIVVKSVYVSEIVPKPYFNKTLNSYLVETLVCFTPLDEGTIFEQCIFYRTYSILANYKISVDIVIPSTPFDTENIGVSISQSI